MFAGKAQGLIRYLLKWFQIPRAEIAGLVRSWSSTGSPTATVLTLPAGAGGTGSGSAYRAHCVGVDGKIYGVPHTASGNILVIDPATNTANIVSMGLSGLGTTGNYLSCTLHPNGKIYAPPLGANHVLIVDTVNQTTEKQTWGLTFSGSSQYNNAIVGKDNKIYCVGQAQGALVIDPIANTAVVTTLGGTMPNVNLAYKYIGAVRSIKNDKLYFGPYNSLNFLVIDTDTQTANTQTFGVTVNNQTAQGISNVPTGNIVAMTHNGGFGMQVDPVANTAIKFAGNKTVGATTGADGNVYAAGFQSTATMFKYDPIANSWTSNAYGVGVYNTGYWGGSMASNGKIYFQPDLSTNASNMIVLNTAGTGNAQTNFASTVQTPYFNQTQ